MTIPEKEARCCDQNCNNGLHNQPLDILFQQQVSRTPGTPAVIFKNQQVSYKELDEKSDAIARKLISIDNSATSDGRIVALLMEPSVEMIVAILGILKSGAAYMPVDVDFPDERVNYLLAESKAQTVITQQHLSERLGNYNGTVMQIDDSSAFTGHAEDRLPVQKNDGQSLACILYTSGSTGKPKGVMIEHRSIARLAINNNFFVLRADDKVLNVQNYCFDATLYNFFSCLLNGATLVLLPKKDFIDLKKLAAYVKKEKPTVIQFTTSFFNLVVDQQINCLAGFRKIFFGGEAASVKHVRTVFEKYGPGKMINVYGPTENTVFSAVHEVNELPADAKSISIGKAVTGTNCLILDENLQQVKQDETGELYVGGIGLSRGYLNQNSLWQSKLVRNPFQPNENLYRTGDLVRIDAQGQLQFVGRKDNQVKINGYRIELEEVAHVLMEYENILMAKVFVDENPNGKSLKAFTVARKKLDLEDLKTFLRKKLPPYMIPASFYETDTAPLNTNGKLDISSVIGNSLKSEMVTGELNGGKGMLQRKLLRLWRNALSNDSIGPDDNFFDQGGNSMKAIQLVADIEKETGASDRLEKLYRYPTVNLFLENISRKSTLHTRYFVPLNNFVAGNDNFFVMPASWGEENDFNEVAVKLDNHANFFKIQLAGLFENKLEKSIPALAGNITRRIKKIPRGEMTFIIGDRVTQSSLDVAFNRENFVTQLKKGLVGSPLPGTDSFVSKIEKILALPDEQFQQLFLQVSTEMYFLYQEDPIDPQQPLSPQQIYHLLTDYGSNSFFYRVNEFNILVEDTMGILRLFVDLLTNGGMVKNVLNTLLGIVMSQPPPVLSLIMEKFGVGEPLVLEEILRRQALEYIRGGLMIGILDVGPQKKITIQRSDISSLQAAN